LIEILIDEKLHSQSLNGVKKMGIKKDKKKEVKNNKVKSNQKISRHIPIDIKRGVLERSAGRCEYISKTGNRCGEKRNLEYDHIKPFGMGGVHSLENIRLVCRSCNQRLAIKCYGQKKMDVYLNSA